MEKRKKQRLEKGGEKKERYKLSFESLLTHRLRGQIPEALESIQCLLVIIRLA